MTVEDHTGKGTLKQIHYKCIRQLAAILKKGRPYSFASLLFNRFAGL